MKPEDLKNSINFVESDDYMQTRLFAEKASFFAGSPRDSLSLGR